MSVFDDFSSPDIQWRMISDRVVGGVSHGKAEIEEGNLTLLGLVSAENGGGFVEVRRDIPGGLPPGTKGLKLRIRGNNKKYYVALRTKGLAKEWFAYRHALPARAHWAELTLPFAGFEPSHDDMPATIPPDQITTMAIAAFGHGFEVAISIMQIDLY